MFKPGDKVVVFQYDGKELKGIVVLTEGLTRGDRATLKKRMVRRSKVTRGVAPSLLLATPGVLSRGPQM
jgi:hypothetical protein